MIYRNIIKGLTLALTTLLLGTSNMKGQSQNSPITINEDKSVTITFVAPEAKKVQVQGNFIHRKSLVPMMAKDGKSDMEKGENGVWRYSSSPLASELYWYNFIVDDSVCYDTRNKNAVRDINTMNNYFIIQGGLADDYVDNTKHHGKLNYIWYPSKINNMTKRRMAVYLPAGYSQNTSKRYPVLYLLHGSGGDETAWADCGRLVQIMDNLIAQNRCVPMIVVMPNGNAELAAAPGEDPNNPDVEPTGNNVSSMFGTIETAFVPEIVNYIDKNYRTIPDKQHRAIAGLSLGGLHTLWTSLNNPEVFNYVGLFSAQTTNALNDSSINGLRQLGDGWNKLKENLPILGDTGLGKKLTNLTGSDERNLSIYEDMDGKLAKFFEGNPKLFYIAVGKSDFTKKLNDDLRKKLDKKKYPYVYNETDGGHTWTNWRKYLVDYLPRIFQ